MERAIHVPGLWSRTWACDRAGHDAERTAKEQGKDYYPTRFQMQGSDGVWRRVYMRVYKRRRPVLVVEDGGAKYSIEPLDAPGITRLTRFYNTRTGGVVRVEFDYENMMEG